MSKAKYLPWSAVTDRYCDSASVVDSTGAELASVGYILSDSKAGSRVSRQIEKDEIDSIVRLFAAAPDLLEALKDFVQDSEARGTMLSHAKKARSLIKRIHGVEFKHRFVPEGRA